MHFLLQENYLIIILYYLLQKVNIQNNDKYNFMRIFKKLFINSNKF